MLYDIPRDPMDYKPLTDEELWGDSLYASPVGNPPQPHQHSPADHPAQETERTDQPASIHAASLPPGVRP